MHNYCGNGEESHHSSVCPLVYVPALLVLHCTSVCVVCVCVAVLCGKSCCVGCDQFSFGSVQ